MNNYTRLLSMVGISSAFMYFLMYLNTYELSHVFYSETRLYMTLLAAPVMLIIMFLFMRDMFKNRKANALIYLFSALMFSCSLYLVRSQKTVDDISWMKAMIPHHSIAILTSSRATITTPKVKDLANRIIKAQESEIKEMKAYIQNLESDKKGSTDTRIGSK